MTLNQNIEYKPDFSLGEDIQLLTLDQVKSQLEQSYNREDCGTLWLFDFEAKEMYNYSGVTWVKAAQYYSDWYYTHLLRDNILTSHPARMSYVGDIYDPGV